MNKRIWIALVLVAIVLIAGLSVIGGIVYMTMEKPISKDTFLKINLSGEYAETPETDPLARWMGGGGLSVRQLLDAIDKASDDGRIAGIILDVRYPMIGFGKIQEISSAIDAYRQKTNKPVYAYGESMGNGAYILALSANEVYMSPYGGISLTGLRSETPFFRKLFDFLGIYPDLLQMGAYKNAADIYTRETMSDAHREATEAILEDIYQRMILTISERLNVTKDEAMAMIDNGPYSAQNAKSAGLIKETLYWDQFEKYVLTTIGKGEDDELKTTSVGSYIKNYRYKGKEKIAVLIAEGGIHSGESEKSFFDGSRSIGSATIAKAFRDIRKDKNIKGVLFRVDSPGGSGLASDVIWRETQLTREKGIPVVASMSDVAGSGGYYISMGCDAIVAQPSTITGSIGIVSGKMVWAGFYKDWFKINYVGLQKGKNADIYTDLAPFTDEQRKQVEKEMLDFYWQFVDKVGQGRGLTRDEVHAIAQGRIWSGDRALQLKLVDALGGYETALKILREKAKLAEDAELKFIIYPRVKGFFERMMEIAVPTPPLTLRNIEKEIEKQINWMREPILLITPVPEIQ